MSWMHPELREGEVLIGNHTLESFEKVGWETKRMGNFAYTVNGELISSEPQYLFPVFAKRSELEKHRIDVNRWS